MKRCLWAREGTAPRRPLSGQDGNVDVALVPSPDHKQAVARESLAGLLTSTEPPRASTSIKDFTQVRRASFEFRCSQRVSIPRRAKKVRGPRFTDAPNGGGMADGRGRHKRTDRTTLLEQSANPRTGDREEV